jgi:hypothetical protein
MPVTAITERRVLRLFALAEPNLIGLLKSHFEAFVGHPFDLLMSAIAKGLFLTEPAGTPCIGFSGFCTDASRLWLSYNGESLVW